MRYWLTRNRRVSANAVRGARLGNACRWFDIPAAHLQRGIAQARRGRAADLDLALLARHQAEVVVAVIRRQDALALRIHQGQLGVERNLRRGIAHAGAQHRFGALLQLRAELHRHCRQRIQAAHGRRIARHPVEIARTHGRVAIEQLQPHKAQPIGVLEQRRQLQHRCRHRNRRGLQRLLALLQQLSVGGIDFCAHAQAAHRLGRIVDHHHLVTGQVHLHMQHLCRVAHTVIGRVGVVVVAVDLPHVAGPGRMAHP